MATTQTAGGYFSRPVRPDLLQRAGGRLRSRLAGAGVARGDAAVLARGVVAAARVTRDYLEGIRALLRSRNPMAAGRSLEGLRRATRRLKEQADRMGPALQRGRREVGDGGDAAALLEIWYRGGGPEELTAEGRLRNALRTQLSPLLPVRVSDLAHLACLWADAQRFHAALRGVLRTARAGETEGAAFLEGLGGFLPDHVVPVDLVGLPGDPGLLEGIPAMISRLGVRPRTPAG
jgi:hypothetical protein